MQKVFQQSLIIFACLITGCAVPESARNMAGKSPADGPENPFNLNIQKSAPRDIQSLQLYRAGSPSNPPVIRLNSEEKLVLEFDYLGETAPQFRAEVTHYNRDWQESPLTPAFYLSGFTTEYISEGLKSLGRRPYYFHYTFEFPGDGFSFRVSGNYLLSVYDYDSGDLLFSLPFFISENEGALETRIEQVYARREDLRRQDQPFSRYSYPEFVEFPQFDLGFRYVQNRFWGKAREVEFFDTSTPGQVQFHLEQDEAFVGDYTFNLLEMETISADGRNILGVEEGPVPPRVILRRDVQSLSPSPRLIPDSRFGHPLDERNASYADVRFSLEAADNVDSTQRIFLAGDFNNWTLSEKNRMRYDKGADLWRGRALIKEGTYAYKYVVLRGNSIDDLSMDQSFISSRREYLTFVYYRDPTRNYDRLLQVEFITTE